MYNNFNELFDEVCLSSTNEEKELLLKEREIIESRNIGNYICLVTNLIKELNISLNCSKSAMDSCLISKGVDGIINPKLIRSIQARKVFEYDALRLDIEIVAPKMDYISSQLEEVSNLLVEETHKFSLSYDIFDFEDGFDTIIVSNDEITDLVINTVHYETHDSNRREADILRSILIIRIKSNVAL